MLKFYIFRFAILTFMQKIEYSLTHIINFEYDKVIAILLYGDITQLEYDEVSLYLDGVTYDKRDIKNIITKYARYGFIDKFYLPENPISEGINGIINYWKILLNRKIFQ